MSQLKDKLAAGEFVVTAEVAPPKGGDPGAPLAVARAFRGIDAVNVTLALAALRVREGIEPVLQVTCRDRNRMALQSDLLGAAALGIENLLLLSGDHARFGDHPQALSVFDLDSVQLLQTVDRLMAGADLAGRRLSAPPHFFAGAAVAPEAEPFELMFQKVVKKVDAGARFFQTQAFFRPEGIATFMEAARPLGVPVIAGVLLLKSAKMAHFLNAHIPGVKVPPSLVERLDQAADPLQEGVAIARELVAAARGCCQGVHLMTLGQEALIPRILAPD